MSKLGPENYHYLIIGGTTKAATTSLFFYLKDHPKICPSNLKETQFFLDRDYPVHRKYYLEDGLEKYNTFFSHCADECLRLDASPDYLYSKGSPYNIHKSLPKTNCLFILREPVDRLISWYRFAKQNGNLPKAMKFDEYLDIQLTGSNQGKSMQHLLALEQGKYSAYLKPFIDTFGMDKILIVFYEDLLRNPRSVMGKICRFVNVNSDFYSHYNFEVFNRTQYMRSSALHGFYKSLKVNTRMYTYDKQFVSSILRRLKIAFEPFYLYLNTSNDPGFRISSSSREYLEAYYAEEALALENLTGQRVPWRSGNK